MGCYEKGTKLRKGTKLQKGTKLRKGTKLQKRYKVTKKVRSYEKEAKRLLATGFATESCATPVVTEGHVKPSQVSLRCSLRRPRPSYEKGTKLRKRSEEVTKYTGYEVTKLRDSNYEEVTK
jgi:hypothetical protein